MKYVTLALDILVACFAVFGFYGFIRWIAGKLFAPKNLLTALEVLTPRQAECSEELIRDTLTGYLSLPSGRLIVLTIAELSEHPALLRAMNTYGIDCYVMEECQEEGAKE
ncbi:MAG: hypothetical protein E7668_05590 [Ruminococcaceae bacterium]|nr:hypothetical protein [Oscillospiraceae bacterium]